MCFPLGYSALLTHRFDRFGFAVERIENSKQLGNLQQVLNPAGEVQKFQLAAVSANGGECRDQLSEAAAIHVIDIGQVHDELPVSAFQQFLYGSPQSDGTFTEGKTSIDVEDDDVVQTT